MKKKLNRLARRKKKTQTSDDQSQSGPVTNDTLSEHREEVLTSGRKYIYPLQHSKHRIVLISTGIFIAAVVIFFSYSTFALYQAKSNTGFLYVITKIIPFPVAKAGSKFVSYESYLFELRHYIHYYQNQQKLDFNSESGKQQLEEYKKRALKKVIDDAYIKQLADQNNISVSTQEVDNQIEIVRKQNRLGASEKGFEDVLRDNFGWTINDFRRSLKQQMLREKVTAALDTQTNQQAKEALAKLKNGTSFAKVAKKYSDDIATKNSGGELNFLVDRTNRDLSAQTTAALFKLKKGQISGIVNNGLGLEILKNLETQGSRIRVAHILFNFKSIDSYINDLKDKHKTHTYIKL